jgi:Tfp pilus assembly protein PilN
MMRINLLVQPAAEEAQPQTPESPQAFQARVFVLAFVGVATVVSFAWWLLGVWQGRLDSQKAAEKAETNRLAGVAAENKRYETELQEINRRIAAVQALADNRRGPVAFLTSLQEAVNRAPALNLMSVGPRDGRVALNGAASSVTAVADLVSALQASDGYQDVLLREYHEDDDKVGRVRFKFNLDFMFQPPPPAVAAGVPPATAKPAVAAPPAERPQTVAEKHHG